MITNFLYDLDTKNRKIISGLCENDQIPGTYDPAKAYPAYDRATFKPKDLKVVNNLGKQGYMVFDLEIGQRYLDVVMIGESVKIQLTDNIAHAACYSEDMYDAILDTVNYFDLEDECKFIFSGLRKSMKGIDDHYDNFFKKVNDSSYCKINKNNKPYFLARKEDNTYFLTQEFSSASKVSKNEVRKVMIINGFVTAETDRHDLSFATLKMLSHNDSYVYAGLNPYRVTFLDNRFYLELNPSISMDDRFTNNEDVFLYLKDISYLISKPKDTKSYYLEIDGKYVKKNAEFDFELVTNPANATKLIDYDIEIIKTIYKIYNKDAKIQRKEEAFYLYYESNEYQLVNIMNPKYDNGKMIDTPVYQTFISLFNKSFNTRQLDNGFILIRDDKYLSIEVMNNNKFRVNLDESAYNASIFTRAEANAVINMFKWDFKEREINNLYKNNPEAYNIIKDKYDLVKAYTRIVDEVCSKKTTAIGYNSPSELRLEIEKNSLEYLRRFYVKDVLDYKDIFEKTITKDVTNILVVAPVFNLELQALAMLDKKVNVTILNETRFGFVPNIYVNDNVKLQGVYRLKLQNLPKSFINKYDMIVFTKSFDEELELIKGTMNNIISSDKDMIFVNTKLVGFDRINDQFYTYFKENQNMDVSRKYFTYENPYTEAVNELDEKFVNYLYKVCSKYQFAEPALDKKYSYNSIVVKKDGNIKDYYK